MMASSSSYAPDLPPEIIFQEKMILQGALITCVGYGVVVTLFILGTWLLYKGMTPSTKKRNIVLMIYLFIEFALATVFVGMLNRYTEMAFIDNREYPGGPGMHKWMS
jgi:hypothetical protein